MALNDTTPDNAKWNADGKPMSFSKGETFFRTSIGDLVKVTKITETLELYAYTFRAAKEGVTDGIQPPPATAPDSESYVYSSFISDEVVNSYTIVRAFDSTVQTLVVP
jgi:hypothetical protein